MKNVLSEDIMIAINFRHIATVDEILELVKTYLDTNVAPIELTRLEALRYRGPHGQTQTETTNRTMQLFRNAEMHLMTGNDIMTLGAINSVTDGDIMRELTKDLRDLRTYQDVVNKITHLDTSKQISKSLIEAQKRDFHANAVNKKPRCQRCGKTDHDIKACRIRPEDIKCDFCGLTGHLRKVCRKLAAEKAENKNKSNTKIKEEKSPRSSRSRSGSKSRSRSKTRPQTPRYQRSRDNSRDREKSDHSSCLQFMLREEMESDTSDSESNENDTEDGPDIFYTPNESPLPQLITDSESSESESESESTDNEDDWSYYNNTYNISNSSDDNNEETKKLNEQDYSSSEEDVPIRGRSPKRKSLRNRRRATPRRKSSSSGSRPRTPAPGRTTPRRKSSSSGSRPRTPAPGRCQRQYISDERTEIVSEPVKWKTMTDAELETFINETSEDEIDPPLEGEQTTIYIVTDKPVNVTNDASINIHNKPEDIDNDEDEFNSLLSTPPLVSLPWR